MKKLALLIAAHDEELFIQTTLNSAINAGIKRENIYVVDDASSDDTLFKIGEILPITNILKVEHSGKAGAIFKATRYFDIIERYEWVHIADADSFFSKNYFNTYRQNLSDEYVAAIGFVQSLKGNWLCSYRAISYSWGQHIVKRVHAFMGMVTILPGPVTSFRTNILEDLDFKTGSLTEDFDLTIQIHRGRLGRIKYIPEAVSYTQDPNNLRAYTKQSLRWYRGFFQGLRRYKVGLRPQLIDMSVHMVIAELLLLLLQLFLVGYILIFNRQNSGILLQFLSIDLGLALFFITFTAILTKRPRILLSIFTYHLIKTFELMLYIRAFVEIIILRKFNQESVGWTVSGRRYKLSKKALAEIL